MKTIWHLELPDGTQCAIKYNYSLPKPYGDQYVYKELSTKDCHACFSVTCNEKYVIDEIFQHLINPSKLFVNSSLKI